MGKTQAVFFPFDLFGSGGTAAGAQLLADAFGEMLADNRREKVPTRARAYRDQVRTSEILFEKLSDYDDWRGQARRLIRDAWKHDEFLFWITGNHLGVLPIYDELDRQTLVVQFDAHLDIYNLSDCTAELSHGNYLLHVDGPLPAIVNLGSRELLLKPSHVKKYYRWTCPADRLAIDPAPAIRKLKAEVKKARRIFLDIDCDCFDPAYFPAVANPLPLGVSLHLFIRCLDALDWKKLIGVAVSEFDPQCDRQDQSLGTLVWLLEYLLLKRYAAEEY